jgi:VanZ family protein
VPNVPGVRFADKVQHAIVFLVLGYSYLRAGRYLWPEAPAVRVRVLAGALAVSVGALLEVLQAFVPYRSAEWFDLWADCLGVGLGMMAARLVDGPMYPCNG